MEGGGAEEGAQLDDGPGTDGCDEIGEDAVARAPAAELAPDREEMGGGFLRGEVVIRRFVVVYVG